MRTPNLLALLSTILLLAAQPPAHAQCQWRLGPENGIPGLGGDIYAQALWDPDGAGPLPVMLIAGGANLAHAGVDPASNIAAYDGARWTSLGAGVAGGQIFALTVFNGELIAAGAFTTAGGQPALSIARFNGTSWFPLGSGLNGPCFALAVYNGSLYAGGTFTTAGGVPALRIARWNGSTWTAVGAGITGPTDTVSALASFNGSLYVGGTIGGAGGFSASNLAAWNGSAWTTAGLGTDSGVRVLRVRDNGQTAPTLIAGGNFSSVNGVPALHIARMSTAGVWTAMGPGIPTLVSGIIADNAALGGGYEVIAVSDAATTQQYWRWSGSAWNVLGAAPSTAQTARSVLYYANRPTITRVGGDGKYAVCSWDGQDWAPIGPGFAGTIDALQPFGADLIFAGDFKYAQNARVNNIIRWNGSTWSAMDNGMNGRVRALHVLNGTLYAAGDFTVAGSAITNNVARWNGAAWESVGLPFAATGPVQALGELSGELIVGGRLASSEYLRRLSGGVWLPMSAGLLFQLPTQSIQTLALSGSTLYAGADYPLFSSPVSSLATWSASTQSWHAISPDLNALGGHRVYSIADFSGLYVGGAGLSRDSNLGLEYPLAFANSISCFSIRDVAGNNSPTVTSLCVYNGALHAFGTFNSVAGLPALGFARTDAAGPWTAIPGGISGAPSPHGTAVYQGELIAAGSLTAVGGAFTSGWARWYCPPPCYANCDNSTTAPVLNVLDFACFLNRFAAGDAYANCDNSTTPPALNVLDFACFLNRFAAGCP